MGEVEHALSYSALMSPTVLIVTALAGVCLAYRWRRSGLALAFVSLICLYALAMPVVAGGLLGVLERGVPAVAPADVQVGAIVVLGGDVVRGGEGRADRLGRLSLQRLYVAALAYRRTQLPVLVTGGKVGRGQVPLADLMAEALGDGFGIAVRWHERRAKSTYENAEFSAALLKQDGITAVLLVTQPWHMPRAIWAFAKFGVRAVPVAPPWMPARTGDELGDYLPSAAALVRSFYALHELVGLAYYRVIYS